MFYFNFYLFIIIFVFFIFYLLLPGERLTSSEKEVLKFASRVNDVMYVPWTDSDATDDITNGLTKFKDGDGLLRLAPKQKGLAEWKRPSQFCTVSLILFP